MSTRGARRTSIYRPEQIDVRLDDVVGIDAVKEEVIRSINLFLAHKTFAARDGRHAAPRPAVRGRCPAPARPTRRRRWPPRPACRSCSSPATSFQSMFYGATAGKIRSYFKELRKIALAEGGAIGFIEEIDAIGGTRNGMSMTSLDECRERRCSAAASLESLPSTFLQAGRPRSTNNCDRRQAPAASSTSCWCRCSPSTSRSACRSSGARSINGSTCCCRRTASCPSPSRRRAEHPADRGDQPRRLARPGAAAPRPLRPRADLQPAGPGRSPGPRRPLPGEEVAPRRARRPRAPGRARRRHPGLHPGR